MRFLASAPCIALALAIAGCGTRPLAKSEGHIQAEIAPPASTASIPSIVRAVPLPPAPQAREAELKYSVVVANQPVRVHIESQFGARNDNAPSGDSAIDIAANVAGARKAYELLRPALVARSNLALVQTLNARFAEGEAALTPPAAAPDDGAADRQFEHRPLLRGGLIFEDLVVGPEIAPHIVLGIDADVIRLHRPVGERDHLDRIGLGVDAGEA